MHLNAVNALIMRLHRVETSFIAGANIAQSLIYVSKSQYCMKTFNFFFFIAAVDWNLIFIIHCCVVGDYLFITLFSAV